MVWDEMFKRMTRRQVSKPLMIMGGASQYYIWVSFHPPTSALGLES